MHGPAAWEGPVRHYGPVGRVAVISDVHANLTALKAVLAEIETADVDLVVSCGDLSWGSQPDETVAAVRELGERLVCVRGNGERAVTEFAGGGRPTKRPREAWVTGRHSAASVGFVGSFPFSVVVTIGGLGAVRFCHGSPRGDTELITPATPGERVSELMAGVPETILVTGHTHLQFDRDVAGFRSVNPGSVGLPYHDGSPGIAHWALLGPGVELRQTTYDVAEAIAIGDRLGDPGARQVIRTLMSPPNPEQVTREAEALRISD